MLGGGIGGGIYRGEDAEIGDCPVGSSNSNIYFNQVF